MRPHPTPALRADRRVKLGSAILATVLAILAAAQVTTSATIGPATTVQGVWP